MFKSDIKNINVSPKLKIFHKYHKTKTNITLLYINIYTPRTLKIREKLSPSEFKFIKKEYISHFECKKYIHFNFKSPLPSILFNTVLNEKLFYLFEDNNFTFFYDDIYAVFINLSNNKGLYIKVDPFKEIAVIQDNIMFFITAILEYLNNNLVFHGLGLRKNEVTSVFIGPSGIGKSTIAKYFNYKGCYGDDAVLIDPKNNIVYSLPFYQYYYKFYNFVEPSRIDFIFFLNKARLSFLQREKINRKSLLHNKYNFLHFADFLPEIYRKKVIESLDMFIQKHYDYLWNINLKLNDYWLIKKLNRIFNKKNL